MKKSVSDKPSIQDKINNELDIENELSHIIVDSAFTVHSTLGPGLLENVYLQCLFHELTKRSLRVEKEKFLPVKYDNLYIEKAYRIDLLVEDKIILEIKAVQELNDIHIAQLLTYLKLSRCRLGFLINFNTKRIKDGIKRIIF